MRLRVLGTLAAIFFLQAASVAANPSERLAIWEWADVPRVVAFGDLHGGYGKLIQLVQGAALADDELNWIGGETHLVVAGDFLDRGPTERPLMDLLRKLQEQSEAVGGQVHVLLGNHEVMTLLRDTRYVNPDAYGDFDGKNSKGYRQSAWMAYLGGAAKGRGLDQRSAFNRRYPRGYFGRQMAFNRHGEYGDWLLHQPVIVKINGIVYVHGGLTDEFASLGIDGINRRALDELNRHVTARELLEKKRIVTPLMDYVQMREEVALVLRRKKKLAPEFREAAQALLESVSSPILGTRGPLWYRGSSFEDERIERDMIERSLELVGASAMVVAHSYTGGNRITSRFHGQLFRLDHKIVQSDKPLALVVEKSGVVVLDSSTQQTSEPVREMPYGLLANPLAGTKISNGALEEFLAQAPVTESRELGRGSTRPRLVVLERDGQKQRAIWKAVDDGMSAGGTADRYQHEVAAYRLGKKLGLDMVPATVLREIDGQQGSLQWWVEGAVDQEAADAYDLQLYKTGLTAERIVLGEIFDSLIGNRGREPSDVLCLVNGAQVFLIDHSEAFSTSAELIWEKPRTLSISRELDDALRALDPKSLAAELGDLLSEAQIAAVLARRDKILDLVEVGTDSLTVSLASSGPDA